VCCSVLQCVAVCCSVLQCVAVCCSVLQCVAVCCSVLHTFITCYIYEYLNICIAHIHICGMNLCALYISTRVTSYIYECVKAHTNYISTRVTSYIYECCGICVNAHIRICVKAHIFVWKHTQIHTYRCEWVLSHRQIACEWVMSRRQTSVWIQHILRNNILVPLSTLTSQCREVGKYAWHDSQL